MGKFIDLTGQRFDKLIVLERTIKNKWGNYLWLCKCDCGNDTIVAGGDLNQVPGTRSCGCLHHDKAVNRKGQRFGKLTVIEKVGRDKHKNFLWKCVCDCGNEKIVNALGLTSGKTKSCGCLHSPNIIGKRFGMLTVIEKAGKDKHGNITWLCKCDCGTEKILRGCSLKRENTKSCGCNKRNIKYNNGKEANIERIKQEYKHGAEIRNFSYNLLDKKFEDLIFSKCHYCGAEPSNKIEHRKGKTLKYNGIDRLDSAKGYEEDNVVSCCKICNMAKRDLPYKEFQTYLDRLVKFRTEQYKQPKGHISPYSFMVNTYCGYSQEIN